RLLVEGLTNHGIAHTLVLSPTTVKSYLQTIFKKLDVSDRTQAAVKAIRLGLVK
ncbi:MAG: response regulator transcription factor, partial [Anaerolineae bacterium]|nr:response regulator transcription factor [Anaerolineae bacterium]